MQTPQGIIDKEQSLGEGGGGGGGGGWRGEAPLNICTSKLNLMLLRICLYCNHAMMIWPVTFLDNFVV